MTLVHGEGLRPQQMGRGTPGAQPKAKATLQRAVDALPKAKHVELLSKFAQLEFRHGSAERGRTVFDAVLASGSVSEPRTTRCRPTSAPLHSSSTSCT